MSVVDATIPEVRSREVFYLRVYAFIARVAMVYDNHGRSRRLRGANEIGRGAHKDVVSMLFGRDSRTADITTNGIKGRLPRVSKSQPNTRSDAINDSSTK